MFSLPGYQIEEDQEVRNDLKKISARHIPTSRPVDVLFFPADGYPDISVEDIYQAFVPLKKLSSDYVVQVHGVEKISDLQNAGVAVIIEKTEGVPLQEYIFQKKPLPSLNFLRIAIQITVALSDLHRAGMVLQGLATRNIGIDPETEKIRINSFSYGVSPDHNPGAYNETAANGIRHAQALIPYISPEQTGRMNRMVDFRTDFYSMGVVFYELLTGTPPFISENPLELIHAHMARYPVPPHAIRSDVDPMISAIVLKLLAKSPEERYQSAYGVRYDLNACLSMLGEKGRIDSFDLSGRDVSEDFRITGRIYGRDVELSMLEDEFERVQEGGLGITMIAGYSGIGKSRLVNEIQQHVAGRGGYYTAGRYDQFQQDIPYSGMLQAYQSLMKQILTEPAEKIAEWKKKLVSALGANANVLIDVIPELELIIGRQPPASDLSPADAQNRFHLVFEKFIQTLATREHPLVMFIDDMQWADPAGLSLMEAFFTGTKNRYFYLIGAFRDNEISPGHPLLSVLSQIRQKGIILKTITLKPIAETDVRRMIADSLQESTDNVRVLSNMVYEKTQGNPFFIRQFLQTLYKDGVLSYDYESGRWQWDSQKISAERITDNVIDFMAAKVLRLSDNTQQTLKIAACIGNRFPLPLLSAAADKSAMEVLSDLREPLALGFVVPEGDVYRNLLKFAPNLRAPETVEGFHKSAPSDWADNIVLDFLDDKVRQAFYSLVADDQKKKLHLRIGRMIISRTDQIDRMNRIFQIVNHLNYGKDLVTDPSDRRHLAELNLLAGKKAKDAAAYRQAIDYLKTGEDLLPENSWEMDYALIFDLKKHRMECEYLCYNVDIAESLFENLLERAKTSQDKAGLYTQKMIMLAGIAKHEEAVKIGLAGLKLLGVTLPRKVTVVDVLGSILALKIRLYARDINSLLDLDEITDDRILLILKMQMNMGLSAYFCEPYLASYLALMIFKLTLKHGNSVYSPYAYVIYGAALCAIFKDYKTGYAFGQLALAANERFGGPGMTAKVLLYFGGGINIWVHHMNQGAVYSRKAIKSALETGDLNYSLYHIQVLIFCNIACGAPLDQIGDDCDRYYEFVEQSKDSGALNYLISVRQWVKCLKGKTHHPQKLDDEFFNESEHIRNMEQDDIKIILFRHYLLTLRLLYIMGDYQGAMKSARQCAKLQIYHLGTIVIPEYYFYHALLLAALCNSASAGRRLFYRARLGVFCTRLEKFSLQCPENFSDKYLLVKAESARIAGRDTEAMGFYHQAIAAARENGFTQNHAIANERAAEFYISKGFYQIAGPFVEEARKSYRKWGATTKFAALTKTHSHIIHADARGRSLREGQPFDFGSIMTSLQMISTEIVLDELLKKLMKIVMENAGARKVQLFSIKGGRTYLEAENSLDHKETQVFKSQPAESRTDLFLPVLNYVERTRKHLALDDASRTGEFTHHAYALKYQPKSVLCLPVIHHSELLALLYLENNIATAVFTPERVEVLKLLAAQAAISLENARLYENVIRNEKQIREMSGKREEESLRYQAQLRSLSSELSLAEERERRRIAVDLHDRIGHALAHASMKLRLVKDSLSASEGKEKLDEINGLISQSILDTQTLTFELSPPILYDLGLESALDWLAEQTHKQHGIPVEFIDDMEYKPIDESLRILLFQATRELLFNMVKHSHATRASVSISREGDNVRILILDNGIGFEASKQKKDIKKGGFGLFSIRERLAHQGGRLEIKSSPGRGAAVTLLCPMQGAK
jgi:predicted ATPase/signal transduction histidine kinase